MRAKKSGRKRRRNITCDSQGIRLRCLKLLMKKFTCVVMLKARFPPSFFFSILPLFLPSNYHIIKIVAVKYNYFSQRNFSIMKIGQQIFYKKFDFQYGFFFFILKVAPDYTYLTWSRQCDLGLF